MEKTKNKKISLISTILLTLIMMFSMFVSIAPVKVNAATNESETSQVQNIVDNATFITFRKGENSSYGRFIFCCYYFPNEVYDSTVEYGMVVFPKWFSERYGVTGNYIEEYEKHEASISIIVAQNFFNVTEGKIMKCGIMGIPEEADDLELSFIFYAKDAEGNIAYDIPRFAAYGTLLAKDYTNSELAEMVGQRLEMETSFKTIVVRLGELVDSFWVYIVIAGASVVVIWGVYIGIRIAVAKSREERINSRDMVKSLVIGIVITFVIAVAMPLLIKGLSSWIMW